MLKVFISHDCAASVTPIEHAFKACVLVQRQCHDIVSLRPVSLSNLELLSIPKLTMSCIDKLTQTYDIDLRDERDGSGRLFLLS